jgi:non-heme Fe2+,alpha-ketoglutarate-dependent halogenase
MTEVLSPEQVERYGRDGVLFPIPVLTADEVARFRGAFEELEEQLGGRRKPVGMTHLFFPWAYELATHPVVAAVVRDVLGPDLLIHGSLILCKYPHDPGYVAWHQDGTYSGLHATPTVSAWIALSESNAENGCMRVVPGSHKLPMLPHLNTYAPQNLLGHGEEIQREVDEADAVDLVLRPGEMSLHHNNIIHGSRASRSDVKRVGFILRFVTPRISASDLPLTPVCGRPYGGPLETLASPPVAGGGGREALARWEEYMRRRREQQEARRLAG